MTTQAHIGIISRGSHQTFEEGACALEWVYVLDLNRQGKLVSGATRLSDSPACACLVIATFVRSWNDGLPDDAPRSRLLTPLLPMLLDTRAASAVETRRSWMAIDWLARVHTPAWLDLAGLGEHAKALRASGEMLDGATARAAQPALDAARDAAWAAAEDAAWAAAGAAAGAAARAAAGPAAESAAWAAAEDAAWAAAGAAAGAAARAAAGPAAGDAAWAAARDAAGAAARAAAWDAAWAAAMSAAGPAAGDAAWARLAPTIAELQDSAADLIRRMCAMTEDVLAASAGQRK